MYRPNLTLVAGACVAAAIGTVAIAASHTVPPSVKGRQGAMQVISLHAGLLGEMARGNSDYDAGDTTDFEYASSDIYINANYDNDNDDHADCHDASSDNYYI